MLGLRLYYVGEKGPRVSDIESFVCYFPGSICLFRTDISRHCAYPSSISEARWFFHLPKRNLCQDMYHIFAHFWCSERAGFHHNSLIGGTKCNTNIHAISYGKSLLTTDLLSNTNTDWRMLLSKDEKAIKRRQKRRSCAGLSIWQESHI